MMEEANETKPADPASVDIRRFGRLDQDVIEAMLVGYFVGDDDLDPKFSKFSDTANADRLIESGIKGTWFHNKVIGEIYDRLASYYRDERRLPTLDDIRNIYINAGFSTDDSENYAHLVAKYHGAVLVRRIAVDILIERLKEDYFNNRALAIWQEYDRARRDPKVGYKKAVEALRSKCVRELSDPSGNVIKEYDMVGSFKNVMGMLKDMKTNPEKYEGFKCGISELDERTLGFRKGQMTVFCGWHGGYKSTVMLNIAYGLWKNGCNVLIASLEMEAWIVMLKLYCRDIQSIKYGAAYQGMISTPDDWDLEKELKRRLQEPSLGPEERKKLNVKLQRVQIALSGSKPGAEDSVLLDRAQKRFDSKPNKIKVINVGQSKKIKLSQIESWLEENDSEWRPDVLVLDYLALVDSEEKHDGRRDLEVGDVCKYLRNMGENRGFSIVTAAQFKRGAMERLRQNGFETPEKAQLGTDDIAESNQIGADADAVFMLFKQGADKLRVFTAKSRHHGQAGDENGFDLQIQNDWCQVASPGKLEDIGDAIAKMEPINARRLVEDSALEGPKDRVPYDDGFEPPAARPEGDPDQ
jgi:replicative DNA helicase